MLGVVGGNGDWCAILIAHQLLWQNVEAPVSIFRNLHLRENLARPCFIYTASTVTNSVQNSFAHLRYYTSCNEVRGGILDSVCLSIRLSVCLSVSPLTFHVCPVASTGQDGFFSYLVQMINSLRGCVACDDPWPWPISSRSFGLDLENRVRSVASTVLDGFFLYLARMITIIKGCVAC